MSYSTRDIENIDRRIGRAQEGFRHHAPLHAGRMARREKPYTLTRMKLPHHRSFGNLTKPNTKKFPIASGLSPPRRDLSKHAPGPYVPEVGEDQPQRTRALEIKPRDWCKSTPRVDTHTVRTLRPVIIKIETSPVVAYEYSHASLAPSNSSRPTLIRFSHDPRPLSRSGRRPAYARWQPYRPNTGRQVADAPIHRFPVSGNHLR